MNLTPRLFLLGLLLAGTLLLTSGCENMQVGVGMSSYDSSTGMSYGFGVSDGPYGRHGYSTIGYSSGGYYGRPYGRW